MKFLKSGSIAFPLTLVLSLIVHAAAVSWVIRLPAPDLARLLTSSLVTATLESGATGGGGGYAGKETYAAGDGRNSAAGTGTGKSSDTGPEEQPPDKLTGPSPNGSAGDDAVAGPVDAPEAAEQVEARAQAADPSAAEEVLPVQPLKSAAYPQGIVSARRERFFFEIYWLGVYVGKAVLDASHQDDTLKITSQVHSAPFISTFYKVDDFAESTVRGNVPVRFRIRQREGKYRSDKETIFDSDGGRIVYFDYLKGTRVEHTVADRILWDVISGFFYLRTCSMEAGKTVNIDVFDSNKFLTSEVAVLGKERVQVADRGEVDAIVVRPVLKSEGLFQSKGEIRIWLSDDEDRVPLRVETKVPIGKVVAELKRMEREP